jgi:hypothetical protein
VDLKVMWGSLVSLGLSYGFYSLFFSFEALVKISQNNAVL